MKVLVFRHFGNLELIKSRSENRQVDFNTDSDLPK